MLSLKKGSGAAAPCGRGSFSPEGLPLHPAPAWYTMASHHPRSSVVTPEALEEAHRNVWLVLKAHGWEPEQELDKDIAETLLILAKMGVTDTQELLRRTLEHFELAPLH
jgi:hypothetical protein